ncbi:MAG: AIR synthase-related protein [Muribaculaceae bacterium]|nr:AIR synthase-related protein [Muribaculaceae bacterium]
MTDARRYRELGVSSSKTALASALTSCYGGVRPGAFCRIMPGGMVLHSDGTGTKALLTDLGNPQEVRALAQDAIVMNTDDMACVGITGGFVINTVINRNPRVVDDAAVAALIAAVEERCARLRALGIDIVSGGGETADVPEMVTRFTLDMSAVGRVPQNRIIDNAEVRAGDVIVGLASYGQATYEEQENSGVGCNGLTWLRHDLLPRCPESRPLLVSPTRTFLPVLREVLNDEAVIVRGMVHITGGGHCKTCKAVPHLRVVKDNMLPVPEVFRMMADVPGVSAREMYQVFNMGCLMEVIVPEESAAAVIARAARYGVAAQVTGRFVQGSGMSIVTPYGTFEYE